MSRSKRFLSESINNLIIIAKKNIEFYMFNLSDIVWRFPDFPNKYPKLNHGNLIIKLFV
jgi:hypothetical protein